MVVLPDGSGFFTGTVGKKKKMEKKASGFTTEYDGDGNAIGVTSREQELDDIFSREGSFGFGGYEQVKASAMRRELFEIVKAAMPLELLREAVKARGLKPEAIGALSQIARADLPATRKRAIARNLVQKLRSVPKVSA